MEWIVKIEGTEEEKKQRIRFEFNPLNEELIFYGEVKLKNNEWIVFSTFNHEMVIDLSQMQKKMEDVIVEMRKRLKEYENLDKGFSVLKWVGFEED